MRENKRSLHGEPTMTPRYNIRFAHIPALLFLCSIAFCLWRLVQHHCCHARHALGIDYCLPHACTTLHDTIFHPFHTARSCFAFAFAFLTSTPHLSNQIKVSSIFEKFSFWLVFVQSCQLDHKRAMTKPTIDGSAKSGIAGLADNLLQTLGCLRAQRYLPSPAPSTTHSHPPHGMSANSMKLYSRNIPLRATYGLTPTRSDECESPLYQ